MIKIKNIGKYMALAVCLIFASCSNDDDNVPSVSFPELQTIECEVNKTADISFESIGSWKLSSSALWCQFVVDGEQVFSCQGNAGKQSIQVIVTDDATELMKSYTANITLEIGGQEKVIYKVSRPVAGYELHVFDADGNEFSEENPIEVAYDSYRNASFQVSSNHSWALVEKPDWINVQAVGYSEENSNHAVCGTSEKAITATPSMVDIYRYIPRKGKLIFKSEDGKFLHSISVVYDGMPEDRIEFSLANVWRAQCQFDVTGKILSTSTSTGISSGSLEAPINFDVYVRNGDYICKLLDWDSMWGYTVREVYAGMTYWYNLDDDREGHLSLNVEENTGAERKGCIMVFPKVVYDKIKNFDEEVLDAANLGINWQYNDYVAIEFSQAEKENANVGFTFNDESYESITLTSENYMKMTDQMGELECLMKYQTTNVYIFSPERPYEMLTVTPNGYPLMRCEFDVVRSVDRPMPDLAVEPNRMNGVTVMGISSGQATISFYDENGTYAVLVIEAWF